MVPILVSAVAAFHAASVGVAPLKRPKLLVAPLTVMVPPESGTSIGIRSGPSGQSAAVTETAA
jgi:hypothetical protein